jgi:hypothetical protein
MQTATGYIRVDINAVIQEQKCYFKVFLPVVYEENQPLLIFYPVLTFFSLQVSLLRTVEYFAANSL